MTDQEWEQSKSQNAPKPRRWDSSFIGVESESKHEWDLLRDQSEKKAPI